MNKWIVVTTINPPTKAIRGIAKLIASGWQCVVIGDRKTPSDWSHPGIVYLGLAAQEARYGELARALPLNHYCRKNLGYLYAMESGADLILETDDDNIPGPGFGSENEVSVSGELVGGDEWINVYSHFSDALIWPRGNPLETIHDKGTIKSSRWSAACPIQQYLADGDPDVDAIYRLLFKKPVNFAERAPVVLDRGSWCSFNSQNTVFFREAFPLLYLPCHVSFRMTDIWRSFVAQAGLWTRGEHLAFKSATVVQERNEHNLMKDFRDEIDGYLNNADIAQTLLQVPPKPLPAFARDCWDALRSRKLITEQELVIFDLWMDRCQSVVAQ